MARNRPLFDPGLTQRFNGVIRRVINKDGSFNVYRTGVGLHGLNFYQYLINISWPKFFLFVIAAYMLVNLVFASVYLALGVEHLQGAEATTPLIAFLNAFFFSTHTFTTVGYGSIAPKGMWTNVVASTEAMTGLMSFAVATGLLYGRFSRPSARIVFSDRAIIAPYFGRTSLQFRIANERTNILMELEAKVLLMTVESVEGKLQRKYYPIALERAGVYFFPLTWTVVHPIDEASPLFRKTGPELAALQAEILILIKGFDDTFSQVVHARYSYRFDEIAWGARFAPAFYISSNGDVVVQVDKISEIEMIKPLKKRQKKLQ